MNEHIAQLAEQAAQESALIENDLNLEVSVDDKSYQIPATFIKAFADLLIKECSELTLDYKSEDHYNGWIEYRDMIKEHFGVEE